tara:strand:+ start:136 stop:660 length:525 start_codon:yes stop_codon:yes gene_type:complete
MMINKLLAFTAFCLLSLSVQGNEINGAFGKALGEVYQGALSVITKTTAGEKVYSFTPQNPHPTFTKYGIILTPKTQKISEIWAWGYFDNSSKCTSEFNVVEVLLDKKYESLKLMSFNSSLDTSSAYYKSGNRRISIRCPLEFSGDSTLYLQYIDKDMQRLLIEEKAEDQNSDGF